LGGKKQSQTKPILFSPQISWGLKSDLKKQSQFMKGQNDVKLMLTMGYENFDGPGQRENKPNSKPIKANLKIQQTH